METVIINEELENEFTQEWDIKVFANDLESAHKKLCFLNEYAFLKVDECIDVQDLDAHIICKKVK